MKVLMSSHKGLRQNMCNLSRPGTLRDEIDNLTIDQCLQPEVRYACCYWVYHLQQSKIVIRDSDSEVYDFLQNYFLYWLEAMSLLQEAFESIRMINSLQLLIDVRHFFSYLSYGSRTNLSPSRMKVPKQQSIFMTQSALLCRFAQYLKMRRYSYILRR